MRAIELALILVIAPILGPNFEEAMADEIDIKGAGDRKGGREKVQVHVRHLGEREKANFKADLNDTLQAVWDESYVELGISKTERDVWQAANKQGEPTSLMDHLGLTLDDARSRGLCDKDFEIAAGTGGA
ncbi:hypothetical protein [Brevundimonas sp.]|uniref:hypothetical protein n=1 Tax=Brevundimonas sp. TaxID=1871086 RepID=UPI002D73A896|nr:hypothetical protein [Brevundimonas sp.]HYC99568.1 hypothetical protein [Brevundimonas sp.]